jgi:hypothetical protein
MVQGCFDVGVHIDKSGGKQSWSDKPFGRGPKKIDLQRKLNVLGWFKRGTKNGPGFPNEKLL